jgi:hypothetical protein
MSPYNVFGKIQRLPCHEETLQTASSSCPLMSAMIFISAPQNGGADLVHIKEALGHTSIATTERYADLVHDLCPGNWSVVNENFSTRKRGGRFS